MVKEPSTDTTGAQRKRRRRRILLLLMPLVLLAGGWQVAKRLIDIERYRPLIDKELELLIELPLTFGAMDLRLFPTPRLVVENVALGEEDFMVFSPQVSVTANLGKLLKRQLDLRTVTVSEARIQLPAAPSDFAERWGAYMLALETPDPSSGKPMLKVTLAQITAPDLQVFQGDSLLLEGRLDVSEVTGGAPEFTFGLSGAGITGVPEAEGALVLTVDADPVVQGAANVKNLRLSQVTGDYRLPGMTLDGALEYQLTQDDQFRWEAVGNIQRVSPAVPLGAFSVTGEYAGQHLTLDSLTVNTDPVTFNGRLQLPPGRGWNLFINEAVLENDGVDWILAYLPELPLLPSNTVTPWGSLEGMHLGADESGRFSVTSGAIHTDGVDLVLDDTGYVLTGLVSDIVVENDTYRIQRLAADYGHVTGEIRNTEEDLVSIELAGSLQLGPSLPLPPSVYEDIRLEGGVVSASHFSTVLNDGAIDFRATNMALTLKNGEVAIWNEDPGEFTTVSDINGTVLLDGGALCLENMEALGTAVSGELVPDPAFEHWTYTASLKSDLTSALWRPFYPESQLSIEQGRIECPVMTGGYTSSDGEIHDLQVEGVIRDLVASVSAGDLSDQVRVKTAKLSAKDDMLSYELQGTTRLLGPVSSNGSYSIGEGALDASLQIAPAEVLALLLTEDSKASPLRDVFGPWKAADIELKYLVDPGSLTWKVNAPIPLSGEARLGDSGVLDSLSLVADFPTAWLAPLLPDGMAMEGPAKLALRYAPDTGNLQGLVNLTDGVAKWQRLEKAEGHTLVVEASGEWRFGGAVALDGSLRLGESAVPFIWRPNGLSFRLTEFPVETFAPLFPAGARLGGHLSGQVGAFPPHLELVAENAAVHLQDGLPGFGLHGKIAYRDDRLYLDELLGSLGDQQLLFQLEHGDSVWSGQVHGDAIVPTDIFAHIEGVRQWWTGNGGNPVAAETEPFQFPEGTVSLSADSLAWGEARVDAFHGALAMMPNGVELTEIRFENGDGRGSGSATFVPASNDAAARLDLNLALRKFDLDVLEELLGDGEREMRGKIDGTAALVIHVPDDDTPLYHAVSGTVDFSGADGTLGKAGLASKFLTALRTTDFLRMRLPSLRDEGVTFRTMAGKLVIDSGRYTLSPYHMEDTTYTLAGELILDYPADTADGLFDLQILDGVTGMASKIPLLGDAADMVNKAFGVELRVTGTANDPAFRAGKMGPMRTLESGAKSLLKGTQKLVGQ